MAKIHLNRLELAKFDTYQLCQAVEERFIDLTHAHRRIRGTDLIPPPSLDKDMLLWRTMAVRFKNGDMRNTQSELIALQNIAQWTLDVNCELRNQPKQIIQWSDE